MVAQSSEPGAHVLNARAFRIELEFRNVGFCGEAKTGVPGEKPLGAEKRTNNKLNPHMTSSPGIEPWSHWWKASALTTAPSLLPQRGKVYLSSKHQSTGDLGATRYPNRLLSKNLPLCTCNYPFYTA